MNPPLGRNTSSRCVVVCRPFESDARMSLVFCTSRPTSRLMMVLFPTPEEPSSAPVLPAGRYCRDRVEALIEFRADDVDGHVARERRRPRRPAPERRRRRPASSAARLVTAPLSRASSRYRSSRRRLKSASSAMTMNTTSTLAATTCSSVTCPAMRRENQLRRGSTATIAPRLFVGTLPDDDPVADCWQLAAARCAMREPPGSDRLDLAAVTPDAADVVELDDHTPGLHIGFVGPRLKRAFEVQVPPERFEGRHVPGPGRGPWSPVLASTQSRRRGLHRGRLHGAGPPRRASDRPSRRCGDRPVRSSSRSPASVPAACQTCRARLAR